MALLVAECGTGKTKIGSAALYAYQHGNPNRKVYDKAFNVVISGMLTSFVAVAAAVLLVHDGIFPPPAELIASATAFFNAF